MISKRGNFIPYSPIRKLVPYAEKAKARGIQVYHLNIGQPDIPTSSYFWRTIQGYGERVLAYGPSDGLPELRLQIAEYYKNFAPQISKNDVFITTGGSEAILFMYIVLADIDDEFLTPEPCYANYLSLGAIAQIKLIPIPTYVEDGFHLPKADVFEKLITPKTKGIILCTPNNPTGTVYTKDEIAEVVKVVQKHKLFLISDEVYREFLFDNRTHTSVLNFPEIDEYSIVLDSVSKRFSACGARIGSIVTKNKDVLAGIMRCGMARLCPPTIEQVGIVELFHRMHDFMPEMIKEYEKRRDVVYEELQKIPGVFAKLPEGAFYITCRLPVSDVERFIQWMLTDFQINNKTTMISPCEGFYITAGKGKNEARIAYVLDASSLKDAMQILKKGIEIYNNFLWEELPSPD